MARKASAAAPPTPRDSVSMGLKVNDETAAQIEQIIAHISHPGVVATKSDAVRYAITYTAGHLPKAQAA